jgi:D-alanyl-D-alanine carboxypeptidase
MVQAVTGRSYARALRRQVLQPLRLRRTGLPSDVDLPRPLIHGYAPGDSGEPEDVSEVVAFGGWAWASGGIVSTPAALTRFVRAYVGGRLFPEKIRARQFRFIPGGDSDPRGPGLNAAGLGLFRYRTACGTVYGHTGSILGYTQLIAATRAGGASVVFTINTQIGEDALPALRRAQELAVCAALGKDRPRA